MSLARDRAQTTALRLGTTTAILAVLAGCEMHFPSASTDPIRTVEVPRINTDGQAPAMIAPGNPTYGVETASLDRERFETIYGVPVTGAASVAPAETYVSNVPDVSFEDNPVISTELGAPITEQQLYDPAGNTSYYNGAQAAPALSPISASDLPQMAAAFIEEHNLTAPAAPEEVAPISVAEAAPFDPLKPVSGGDYVMLSPREMAALSFEDANAVVQNTLNDEPEAQEDMPAEFVMITDEQAASLDFEMARASAPPLPKEYIVTRGEEQSALTFPAPPMPSEDIAFAPASAPVPGTVSIEPQPQRALNPMEAFRLRQQLEATSAAASGIEATPIVPSFRAPRTQVEITKLAAPRIEDVEAPTALIELAAAMAPAPSKLQELQTVVGPMPAPSIVDEASVFPMPVPPPALEPKFVRVPAAPPAFEGIVGPMPAPKSVEVAAVAEPARPAPEMVEVDLDSFVQSNLDQEEMNLNAINQQVAQRSFRVMEDVAPEMEKAAAATDYLDMGEAGYDAVPEPQAPMMIEMAAIDAMQQRLAPVRVAAAPAPEMIEVALSADGTAIDPEAATPVTEAVAAAPAVQPEMIEVALEGYAPVAAPSYEAQSFEAPVMADAGVIGPDPAPVYVEESTQMTAAPVQAPAMIETEALPVLTAAVDEPMPVSTGQYHTVALPPSIAEEALPARARAVAASAISVTELAAPAGYLAEPAFEEPAATSQMVAALLPSVMDQSNAPDAAPTPRLRPIRNAMPAPAPQTVSDVKVASAAPQPRIRPARYSQTLTAGISVDLPVVPTVKTKVSATAEPANPALTLTLKTPAQPKIEPAKPVVMAALSKPASDSIRATAKAELKSALSAEKVADKEVTDMSGAKSKTLEKLSGTSWRVVELMGDNVGFNAELHFDGASGFAGGKAPCNSYGGEYGNEKPGKFTMSSVFTTQLECDALADEQGYLSALRNAMEYETTPNFSELMVKNEAGETLLRFEAF